MANELSELNPQFRDANGRVDGEKYAAYRRSLGYDLEEVEGLGGPSYSDIAVAQFLAWRQEEAIVFSEFHLLPGNLPYNEQPWWKWELWKRFLDGQAEGRAQERK